MKILAVAAFACLSLALMSDSSFAARKMATVAGQKCTTGAVCATNCSPNNWCTRYVCVNSKWEKRLPGCTQPFCGGPAC